MAETGFISFEVDPGGRFQKAIDQALKESIDLKEPFALCVRDFYRTQKPLFSSSNKSIYADLSERYKRTKRHKFGRIYPILVANGYLEEAATVEGASGNVTEITSESFEIAVDASKIPYAPFHQSGTSKMPRRPFLFIGPEEPIATDAQRSRVDRWTRIIEDHITRKMAKGLA